MARTINKLSVATCKALAKPGRHSDGGGLYLNIAKVGSKSWVFLYQMKGKGRREMGLGSFPAVSLARARQFAEAQRELVADGKDPIEERDKAQEPTFGKCVEDFLTAKESDWKNAKHRQQWRMTLTEYCKPISATKVSDIAVHDVLKVLNPIWTAKPETAQRLRGRIERVLDFAKVKGWRPGENPALWRGNLQPVLSKPEKLTRGHHPAMPYEDVPAFVDRLQQSASMSARALEFLILTALRTSEVIGAQWHEINFDEAIWTVPIARMKRKRSGGKPLPDHVVPLSDRAVEILQGLYDAQISDFIFPGQVPKRPLSTGAMDALLGRWKVEGATVHGFRSSFRDWAGDKTTFPREVAEASLHHAVGNAVEQSYRRRDGVEKRRALIQSWADYCSGPQIENVVRLRS